MMGTSMAVLWLRLIIPWSGMETALPAVEAKSLNQVPAPNAYHTGRRVATELDIISL